MIFEIAQLRAKAGHADQMREGLTRARAVISRSPGYLGSTFVQGIEDPLRITLLIQWDSIESHMKGFREGPLFAEWRSHWAEHMDGPPDVQHYSPFAGPQP